MTFPPISRLSWYTSVRLASGTILERRIVKELYVKVKIQNSASRLKMYLSEPLNSEPCVLRPLTPNPLTCPLPISPLPEGGFRGWEWGEGLFVQRYVFPCVPGVLVY